ncbi:carboxypeptidase-like regulatory domain-containing protein [Elongatibacter sediminis]|uniref:Carboxypeptidase-like regulatory domain-containing protein n=1 Tax=Elongatibacter sediminis TaxID=3119006 RepID=A0AAW9R7I2_9GAMM
MQRNQKFMLIVFSWLAALLAAPNAWAGASLCLTDADCTDPSLPICNTQTNQCGASLCLTDADCTDPSLPVCNTQTNQCEAAPAGCSSDADCINPSEPICNTITMMCEAPPPGCLTDADCTDPSLPTCNTQTNQCEAAPAGCSSDADCIDPAMPYCNIPQMTCQANVVTTLSGKVVDRSDSSTAVSPVTIQLLNPASGAPTGYEATSDIGGNWEIYDLPPGSYKVFFDAHGAASDYLDELYPEILCDAGACDKAGDGVAVAIAEGDNTLNYDLPRAYSLSGTVRDQNSQPMPGVQLQVYDEDGQPLGVATTTGTGEWIYPRIPNSTYYIKTIPASIPGYRSEIWDDILCYACDVMTTGDPVTVNHADVSGLLFQLSPVPPALHEDGFEDPP